MDPGEAEDLRTRMRRALTLAMKARDKQAVAALRSTLAAIDNAEAVSTVDASPAGRPGDGPAAGSGSGDGGTGASDSGYGAAAASGSGGGGTGASGSGDGGPAAPGAGEGHPAVAGSVQGLGAAEVERRSLTAEEVRQIIRGEVTEREAAARSYEQAGRSQDAARLRAEADLLGTYLSEPGPHGDPGSLPSEPGPQGERLPSLANRVLRANGFPP
jgi:uncharacterized protein YqeY